MENGGHCGERFICCRIIPPRRVRRTELPWKQELITSVLVDEIQILRIPSSQGDERIYRVIGGVWDVLRQCALYDGGYLALDDFFRFSLFQSVKQSCL